jgi:hypothetical protein
VKPDSRSMQVALVADAYVNPPPGGLDLLPVLAGADWGVMQLPAASYPDAIAARMLAEVAEQVEEFSSHDYAIVVIGERDGLAEALGARGIALPDQIIPATAAELSDFLAARPSPAPIFWQKLASAQAAAPVKYEAP